MPKGKISFDFEQMVTNIFNANAGQNFINKIKTKARVKTTFNPL